MYLLARSDGSVLSRQMCETKDILHVSEEKLRERDAEVARLRAELGRGARAEALEASPTGDGCGRGGGSSLWRLRSRSPPLRRRGGGSVLGSLASSSPLCFAIS